MRDMTTGRPDHRPEQQAPPDPGAKLRNLLVDGAVAAGFALAALPTPWTWRSGFGPLPAIALALPLAGRRYRPLLCFAVQLLVLGLVGRTASAPPTVMLAVAVGGYFAVGASGRWPRIATAAGVAGVTVLLHFSTGTGSSILLLLSVWLTAATLHSLWLRSQTAERYAQALEREHQAERRLAVQAERARIARELHDTLGHHVSVMLIQAGAARLALEGPPAAQTALQEVETVGRQAMGELRQLLALLGPEVDDERDRRDGGDDRAPRSRGGVDDADNGGVDTEDTEDTDEDREALAPLPGLTRLGPLLDRIRAAGLPVALVTQGQARPLGRGVDLAAYRVVQEGLTNALKYAGGTPTEVTIAYEAAGLTVTVRDRGGATTAAPGRDGSGRGLLGLRERVALYDGRFDAGRQADGGYRIRAHFPDEAL